MTSLMKKVRAAAVTGLVWAVIWGPLAVLIGLIVDPDGSMDEMWIAIGAYPGFLCGVLFSVLLGLSIRRTGAALSISQAAVWGGVAGLMVGLLPFLVASSDSSLFLGALVIGSITVLSTISAVGSALWRLRST